MDESKDNFRSFIESELSIQSVEETYSDDWYANNPEWYK